MIIYPVSTPRESLYWQSKLALLPCPARPWGSRPLCLGRLRCCRCQPDRQSGDMVRVRSPPR
jgi:hypothetical protein